METLGGTKPETYASRLRGSRFWIPMIIFVIAVAAGFYVIGRNATTPTATPPGDLASVDPLLSRLIGTLERNSLICTDLTSDGPRHATCRINELAVPTDIRTFPTVTARMVWVRRQEAASKRVYLQDRTISYVITRGKWAISGIWSAGGRYADTSNPAATVAQDVNKFLDGCLELLPQEAGSCAF